MRTEENDNWPRHSDGSRKRIGEMTPQEQATTFVEFARTLDQQYRQLALLQEREQLAAQGIRVNH